MEHNPTQPLTIEVETDFSKDIKILRLNGPMTIHNFFDFQEMARQKPLPRLLVVDLREVPYIDSAALGAFVGIHVSCDAAKRKYALVGANDRLNNLFDMTHVREFLALHDSMDEALAL